MSFLKSLFGKSAQSEPQATLTQFDLDQQLFRAAETGDAKAIEAARNQGANVNARNHKQQTPLHAFACEDFRRYVSESDRLAAEKALLEAGADVHAKDKEGNTPLHQAARKGFIEAVKPMVAAGTDLTLKNGENLTAYEVALKWSGGRVADYLKYIVEGTIPRPTP